MMKRYLPFLLLSIFLLGACSSGKKALVQGDYNESVLKAVNRLRQSPNNKNARETLKNAYPRLLIYNKDQINRYKTSSDPYRWEKVVNLYAELNHAYDEINRAPAAVKVIPHPENFLSDHEAALTRAAETRYAMGEKELDKGKNGNREAAKMAYEHFEKAHYFKPGFKNARNKMDEAQDLATVYVLIEPIPMHSRTLSLRNEFFYNQIVEYVRSAGFSKFVRFYSDKEANSMQRDPDQVILMMFDEFVVGQSSIKETVLQRDADSVIVGQVEVVERGRKVQKDVYGSVSAKVHQFEKVISSGGLLDFRILDPRSRNTISQKKFPGTFVWSDRWGYFNGDERALTPADRDCLRKDREVPSPAPQDLFTEFTKPIYSQVTGYIRNYYDRY